MAYLPLIPDPDSDFFTRHKFGVQNFVGPPQIIATASIGLDPFPRFPGYPNML